MVHKQTYSNYTQQFKSPAGLRTTVDGSVPPVEMVLLTWYLQPFYLELSWHDRHKFRQGKTC